MLRVHDAPSDHASAVELKTEMYRARVERDALQYQVTQLEVERDALKAECERRAAETGMLRAEIALAGATITKESA